MIVYRSTDLDNRDVREQAATALSKKIITQEELDRIYAAYPCNLYTPNFFVRVGLFLLTVLAVLCCLGLFVLASGTSDRSLGTLFIFFGLMAYGALELFIHTRGIFRAGTDDALLLIAGLMIVIGTNILSSHIGSLMESAMILVLALWGFVRYCDRLMAVVSFAAFLCLIFYRLGESPIGRALLPFVVMVVSVALYLLFTRLSALSRLRFYHSGLVLLRVAALLSFYAAGNYYVVREVNAFISHHPGPIAPGFLWWALTGLVPILYIVRGVQKKDIVFLWTGLALVAGAAFTVRYYYHILPAELAMIICGSILIAGAWSLIHWLHEPKFGFTSTNAHDPAILEGLPVEGVILAESFRPAAGSVDKGVHFGGGTSGGGGAG
ncbi:MAG TPA: hypothetical protein VN824_18800, partial [Puia sp.]|nr:hypothetical protein [Puia sp.]